MTIVKSTYRRAKLALVIILASVFANSAYCQYKGEFGVLGGVSFYNGDANPTKPFYENNPLYGALLRIRLNDHFMLKFDVDKGTVSGSTENITENKYPQNQVSRFENDFVNIGAMFELLFFKYGYNSWDKEVKRHTPYVALGPSLCMFDSWNGRQYGGGLGLGVGYKVKVGPRVNIGVEWDMHKLFRDDLDVADYDNELLNDPYKMESSKIKNNDWYSCAYLFVTFDIFKRRGMCRSY